MARLDTLLAKYDLSAIEAAVERRRRSAEKDVARLEERRRLLEAEVHRLERQVLRLNGARERRPNARRLNDITLAEALEKVLRSRKGPVHYKDLTEAVTKRGLYKTKSKNLLSTVAVTLQRDSRFRKVGPGIYRLR